MRNIFYTSVICIMAGTYILDGPSLLAAPNNPQSGNPGNKRPNIILVLTDDQGYGDLGFHGNPILKTPNIDLFARESLAMTRFYVNPLCAPTRASLMTGRYHLRTGVLHTSRGGAKMSGEEVTIAELLSSQDYQTGIFGKWHLGDNYPMRPQDQGFQEALIHRSGGISQTPDPEGTYFKPILYHNGERKVMEQYCTDIFFDAALSFIDKNRDNPFFIYLPTNAPHGPLQVAEQYYQPYMDKGLDENTARVYGMIQNLDENFGRLVKQLDDLKLADNTILIFMTDNGAAGQRFTTGLRESKGSVYEGGIRVPFYVRWPEQIEGNREIDRIAAHIDLLPTFLEACKQYPPEGLVIDGTSLLPLWTGNAEEFPSRRTLYVQHIKAMVQQPYQNAAIWNQQYKLVMNPGTAFETRFEPDREQMQLELYDIKKDPGEQNNIASTHQEQVDYMLSQYQDWFGEMKDSRGFAPGLIHIDPGAVNPVELCRYQDASHPYADSPPEGWPMRISKSGLYRISIRESGKKYAFSPAQFWKEHTEVEMLIQWDGKVERIKLPPGHSSHELHLREGQGVLDAWFEAKTDENIQKFPIGDVLVEYLPDSDPKID